MNNNYMDSIYSVLDSNEVDYNDDVIFVDNPDDYEFENEFNNWGDDVTIIGDFEEDEFNFDLGEGYIPLPKGDYEEHTIIVIDENYVLDEYEIDLVGDYVEYDKPLYSTNKIKEEESLAVNVDEVQSIVNFKEEKDPVEDLTSLNMCPDDDRVIKTMAREYMDNLGVDSLTNEEFLDSSDDTSWVDDPDLFGNDISVIIADDPEAEFVEDDFVDGSFEDWINQNYNNETF